EVIPARTARGLWIRCDYRNTGLHEVTPVPDPLGIALFHQEHDGRSVRRGVVGQPALPVLRQELALRGDSVDIGRERQCDDVCRETVDDGTGLLAGTPVRLVELDVLAGLLLPVLRKCRVVGDI